MTYLSRDRVQHQNSSASDYGLNSASRARKIATFRSFYNYLTNKVHLLSENPVKDIDSPKTMKSLPKYLTLDQSIQLLGSVDGKNRERDYCILTLFLNCGLRISELVGLNLNDIQDEALRILGKGNKVRIVYLNDACKDALRQYLAVRRPIVGRDCNAMSLALIVPVILTIFYGRVNLTALIGAVCIVGKLFSDLFFNWDPDVTPSGLTGEAAVDQFVCLFLLAICSLVSILLVRMYRQRIDSSVNAMMKSV